MYRATIIIILLCCTFAGRAQYPLTRDTLNTYPDTLIIEGKLIDATIAFHCGNLCTSGTLKIEVLKWNARYKHPYIYVAIPCMASLPEEYKTRKIWKLRKLQLNNTECFWSGAVNKFDTTGIPFYLLSP